MQAHSLAAFAVGTPLRNLGDIPRSRRLLSQVRPCFIKATLAPSTSTLKKNRLGSSDLLVTEACLGTMTWGVQNSEADAHAQLDYAIKERGVNFLDTAEVYPIPTQSSGYRSGATEEYIGTWLRKNPGFRDRIIIASKVMGYSKESKTVAYRFNPPSTKLADARHDRESLLQACEGSLRRLQTDYIDLYQLHWPDRYAPVWGGRSYNLALERDEVPFEDIVSTLKELLDSGKIRTWGLSNETPYGVAEFVHAADKLGVPRPVTIQNQFCLFNRQFEGALAEMCAPSHYNIGLLPWSVLGGGILSGKYRGKMDKSGKSTDDSLSKSRFVQFPYFQARFFEQKMTDVIEQYHNIASAADISLATMAQKFCATRWYIPSTIIGATTLEQLEENINAFGVELSEDVLQKIDKVHAENKDPVQAV